MFYSFMSSKNITNSLDVSDTAQIFTMAHDKRQQYFEKFK